MSRWDTRAIKSPADIGESHAASLWTSAKDFLNAQTMAWHTWWLRNLDSWKALCIMRSYALFQTSVSCIPFHLWAASSDALGCFETASGCLVAVYVPYIPPLRFVFLVVLQCAKSLNVKDVGHFPSRTVLFNLAVGTPMGSWNLSCGVEATYRNEVGWRPLA